MRRHVNRKLYAPTSNPVRRILWRKITAHHGRQYAQPRRMHQPVHIDHAADRARGKSAARKAEDADAVAILVVFNQKAIGLSDVVKHTPAQRQPDQLDSAAQPALKRAHGRKLVGRPNTGVVVGDLARCSRFVNGPKQLDHIGVFVDSQHIAGAVEKQHQRAARLLLPGLFGVAALRQHRQPAFCDVRRGRRAVFGVCRAHGRLLLL